MNHFYHRSLLRAGLLALCLGLTGCQTFKPAPVVSETVFHLDNVYVAGPTLPQQVKRVAVLPVATDENYSVLCEGRDELEPVLHAELIKAMRFETVQLTPEALRACTGLNTSTSDRALPAEMFSALRDTYGCDAVLFSQLTVFRAWPPLAVGWRMKLVDATSGQILWAGDEVFDAGNRPAHPAPAWPWCFPTLTQPSPEEMAYSWRMETSPRLFAQYTLDQLFETLPVAMKIP